MSEGASAVSATVVNTRQADLRAGESRLHVFVLIDALGWKVIESADFLNDLLPHRQPLRTVLGFSSGAIPTILTGMLPSETGHWNLYYFDPKGSPFRWLQHFDFLPARLLDNRYGRKLLKEMGKRVLGLGPGFQCLVRPDLLPYFNWVEKRNIYGERAISGAPSIFDQLAEKGIPYKVYSYHQHGDAEIVELAQRDLRAGQHRFFFLYLSELDHFLHEHCLEPEKIARELGSYAARLRAVYEAARECDPGMTFTVLSDHGMTPVRERYDVVRDIEALGLNMPQDYLAVYDSTMARFWFFNERARQQVRACLEKIACGRILGKRELRDLGIYFPDGRFGELIFLVQPGWIFASSNFHGRWMPVGMHGYHPDDPWSDAVFLSNQEPPATMRSIRDVYGCLSLPLKCGGGVR